MQKVHKTEELNTSQGAKQKTFTTSATHWSSVNMAGVDVMSIASNSHSTDTGAKLIDLENDNVGDSASGVHRMGHFTAPDIMNNFLEEAAPQHSEHGRQ